MTWNNHDVVGDVLMTDGILNELEHETSKAHDTFFITKAFSLHDDDD